MPHDMSSCFTYKLFDGDTDFKAQLSPKSVKA